MIQVAVCNDVPGNSDNQGQSLPLLAEADSQNLTPNSCSRQKNSINLNEAELADCCVSVDMMQAIEHRRSNHLVFNLIGKLKPWLIELGRNLLLDALMIAMLIVILNKCNNDEFELVLVEDEEVVKTFSSPCADQSFTVGICFGSLEGFF